MGRGFGHAGDAAAPLLARRLLLLRRRLQAPLEGHAQQRNAVRVDLAPLASDAGLESHQRLEGIGRHEALAESLVGTDRKNRRQALTPENTGETERGTAEAPALRGLRAPRVP